MVNTPALKVPVTPFGKFPVRLAPAPLLIAYVIFVKAVLIHLVWVSVPDADDNEIVAFGLTVMVPDAELLMQVPVVVTV